MKVTGLHVFPVKSLGGVALSKCALGPRGLLHDREFMLVDEAGQFLTQRTLPELTHFQTRLTDQCVEILHPDLPPLIVRLVERRQQALVDVTVWRDTFKAASCGASAANWFSRILKRPVMLVRMVDNVHRRLDETYAPNESAETAFADAYPVLAVNQSSLDALNARMSSAIPMNRFRGNVVIEGTHAWTEDAWATVKIGTVEFDAVKPCTRCVVITTDQSTGTRHPEALKSLTDLHFWEKQGAVFGMNLVPRADGTIAIGDEVTVVTSVSDEKAWKLGPRKSGDVDQG